MEYINNYGKYMNINDCNNSFLAASRFLEGGNRDMYLGDSEYSELEKSINELSPLIIKSTSGFLGDHNCYLKKADITKLKSRVTLLKESSACESSLIVAVTNFEKALNHYHLDDADYRNSLIEKETEPFKQAIADAEEDGEEVAHFIATYNLSNDQAFELFKVIAEQGMVGARAAVLEIVYDDLTEQQTRELAAIIAQQYPEGVPEIFSQSSYKPNETELFALAMIAATEDEGKISECIEKYKLTPDHRFKVAMKAAAHSVSGAYRVAKNIGSYDLTKPQMLEVAKVAAEHNPLILSENITEFKINKEADRFEIAKKVAAVDGNAISQLIDRFNLSPEHEFEIAKMAAAESGWAVTNYISKYNLSPTQRFEVAKIAAAENSWAVSEMLGFYGIEKETDLFELAKIAVANSEKIGEGLFIENYKLTEAQRFDLVVFTCEMHPESLSEDLIKYYGLEEEQFIDLIKAVAAQNGKIICGEINSFGLTKSHFIEVMKIAVGSEYENISNFELAKRALLVDGFKVSELIGNFDLTPAQCFELAKIVIEHAEKGVVFQDFENYNLTEPYKFELVKILAGQQGHSIAAEIGGFGLTKEHFIEVMKIAFNRKTENTSNFELAKMAASLSGEAMNRDIEKYELNRDQRLAIAKIAVREDLIKVTYKIANYNLTPAQRFEVAKIAANQEAVILQTGDHRFSSSVYFVKFDLINELNRFEVAKIAAANNGLDLLRGIDNYDLTPVHQCEVLKIAAMQNGEDVAKELKYLKYLKLDKDYIKQILLYCICYHPQGEFDKKEIEKLSKGFLEGFPSLEFLFHPEKILTREGGFKEEENFLFSRLIHTIKKGETRIKKNIKDIDNEILSIKNKIKSDNSITPERIAYQKSELEKLEEKRRGYVLEKKSNPKNKNRINEELKKCNKEIKKLKREMPSEKKTKKYHKEIASQEIKLKKAKFKLDEERVKQVKPIQWLAGFCAIAKDNNFNKKDQKKILPFIRGIIEFRDPQLRYNLMEEFFEVHKNKKGLDSLLVLQKKFNNELNSAKKLSGKSKSSLLDKPGYYSTFCLLLSFLNEKNMGFSDAQLSNIASIFRDVSFKKSKNYSLVIRSMYKLVDNKNLSVESKRHLLNLIFSEKRKAIFYEFDESAVVQLKEETREAYRKRRSKLNQQHNKKKEDCLKDLLKDFSMLQAAVNIGLESRLKTIVEVQEITQIVKEKLLEITGGIKFPKGVSFSGRYQETFGNPRVEQAIYTYLSKVRNSCNKRLNASLGQFLSSVLIGDFPAIRYRTDTKKEGKSHMGTVFEKMGKKNASRWMARGKPMNFTESLLKKERGSLKKDEEISQYKGWRVVNSDRFDDLLLCGTEVDDSCMSVNKSLVFNKCLLAYIMDGKNRVIVIKDNNGKIVARRILRILWDDKNKRPVLYQEKTYKRNSSEEVVKDMEEVLDNMCLKVSKDLALTLVRSKTIGGKQPPLDTPLISLPGPAVFEYFDAGDAQVVEGMHTVLPKTAEIIYSPTQVAAAA